MYYYIYIFYITPRGKYTKEATQPPKIMLGLSSLNNVMYKTKEEPEEKSKIVFMSNSSCSNP